MPSFKHKSIWLSKKPFGNLPSLLLGITLLFPLKLLGAEPSVPQTQQSDHPDPANSPSPRDYLSGKFINFATDIDRFFGDDRNYQESNQSVFQLDLTRVTGYDGDRKIVISGRAKMNLPAVERRFHLLLETDPEKNITNDSTSGRTVLTNHFVAPESYAVAARFEDEKESTWHYSTDAGIKVQTPLNPFARARASVSVPMGLWRMKGAESVFWFNTIGAGESTQIDIEHFLSEPVLFRATSSATWLNDTKNFDLRQDLSIYHAVNEHNALLYQTSAIGVSQPQYQVTEYVISLLYRHQFHQDWMFFELSPQLHFPNEKDFHSQAQFNMRLEMLFDGKK